MRRVPAGPLAFPSGKEFLKKATVAPTDNSNYAFSQTLPFPSLLAFYFEAIEKLSTLHFSNGNQGIHY